MKVYVRVIYPFLLNYMISIFVFLSFSTRDGVELLLIESLVSAPLLFLMYKSDQKQRSAIKRSLALKQVVYISLLGIGTCFFVNNIIAISRIDQIFSGVEQVNEILYAPPVWMQLLTIGIAVPITEELLFRGLLFGRLRDRLDFKTTMLISAICFGLVHGNVAQGLYALILGLVMAWVYEHYKTILAPVLFHSAANVSSIIVTDMSQRYEVINSNAAFYFMTVLSIVLIIVSVRNIRLSKYKEVLI